MDYPYEIPANWKWVKLSDLYFINPKNNVDDELDAAFIPMEMINAGMNSQFTFTTQKWGKIKKGHTHFRDGDVAFAKISPCFENRKSMIINDLPNGIGAGTTELIVLRNTKILQTYTYWIVNSENFIQGGRQTYSGTVGQQRISMDYVKDYFVPLAPLSEQHRIVARIESLFSKLDEAKEKAQSVLDGFENRRAAILHKAFTGELTKKWRDDNSGNYAINEWENYKNDVIELNKKAIQLPPSWKWIKLGALGYTNIGLTYSSNDKSEDGIIVLRSSNIQNGKMNYDDIVRVNINIPQNKMCQKGDLLICARNGSKSLVGKTAIVDSDGMSFGAFMAIFRSIYNPYIYHFLCSPFFRDLIDKDVGTTTINQVTQAIIKNLPLPFAPVDEQLEIVRILDRLLSQEQQAKQAAEAVIAQIDVMKKSILARAFRGELGTNDPSDELVRI